MSFYDYRKSIEIAVDDPPFYAIVMAAMRKADPRNLEALNTAFPGTFQELQERIDANFGLLPGEQDNSIGIRRDADGSYRRIESEATNG